MRRVSWIPCIACVSLVMTSAACSDPSGLPDLPDASRITGRDPPPVSDAGVDAQIDTDDGAVGPSTFTTIYEGIIQSNATAVAKCQNIACHGAPGGQAGLKMGATKDDAYNAITTFNAPSYGKLLVKPGPTALADSAILKVTGPPDRYMPLNLVIDGGLANSKLSNVELRGIEAWLKRGAPND